MLLIGACARTKSIQADKSLSVINAVVLAAAAIYATLKSQEPWTNGAGVTLLNKPMGWNQYCYLFKPGYPNVFLRCWLINGLWLGTLFTCLTWLLGGILVWSRQRSDFFGDYHDNDYNSDVPPLPPASTTATTTKTGYDQNGSPPTSPTTTPYKAYNTAPTPPVPNPPAGRNNYSTPYSATPYAGSRKSSSYGDDRRYNTPGTDNGSKYPAEDSDRDNYYASVPARTAAAPNTAYNTNTAAGYGGGYNSNQGYNNTGYSQPTYNNSRNVGGGGGYNAYNNSSSGAGYSATPQGYNANNNYGGRTAYN